MSERARAFVSKLALLRWRCKCVRACDGVVWPPCSRTIEVFIEMYGVREPLCRCDATNIIFQLNKISFNLHKVEVKIYLENLILIMSQYIHRIDSSMIILTYVLLHGKTCQKISHLFSQITKVTRSVFFSFLI